jgi:hypothetical protein
MATATAAACGCLSSPGAVAADAAGVVRVSIPVWHSQYDWAGGDGYAGWAAATDSPDAIGYGLSAALSGTPGLWSWPLGAREYRPGSAGWVLRAPGTTRIATATFHVSYRDRLFSHHCVDVGLRSGVELRAERTDCKPPAQDEPNGRYSVNLQDPSSEPSAKEAFVRLRMPVCNNPAPTPCSKYVPAQNPTTTGSMARADRVDMVLVDDDRPIVTPSGAFFDLDGTYIDGKHQYALRLDVRDAGAGIAHMALEHFGNAALLDRDSACDEHHHTAALGSLVCPDADFEAMNVDTQPMPEGTRRFRATATDPAGNLGAAPWTVIIDRTPPTPPSAPAFTKPEEGSAQAAWTASADPVLPDGTPGSGVAGYRARHRVGGGAWSDWSTLGESDRLGDEVYDQPAGTPVEFEIVSFDRVGNVSDPVQVAGEVDGAAPQVTTAGPLDDVAEGYIRGDVPTSVDVVAADAGIGVRRVWLEREGAGEIVSADGGCSPRFTSDGSPWKALCPRTTTRTLAVDPRSLPEGTATFTAHAVDRASNDGATFPWHVSVDRSRPSVPSKIQVEEYNPDSHEAELIWDDGEDPDLPGSVPGSGVTHDEYRVLRDGVWSGWQSSDEMAATVDGLSLGDAFEVEVRSVDAVGNLSDVASSTVTVNADDVHDDNDEATLAVQVRVAGGVPADGIPINVDAPGDATLSAETDADGRVEFGALPAGVYAVEPVSDDRFGTISTVARTLDLAPGDNEVVTLDVTAAGLDDTIQHAVCSILDDVIGQACRLNSKELDFCERWWSAGYCIDFAYDQKKAFELTRRVWDFHAQPDGTKANAFTHSYYVAMMSFSMRYAWFDEQRRQCGSYYDCRDLALEFSTIHESKHDMPAKMDLHNNARGWNFANDNQFYYNSHDGQVHKHNDEFLCSKLLTSARRARRYRVAADLSTSRLVYMFVHDNYGHGFRIRTSGADCSPA